jgi:hypothetical protein
MMHSLRLKIAVFSVALVCLATRAASAETLTYENSDNGVYPYEMSIDSSFNDVAMDCITDYYTVTPGETWAVTATSLGSIKGTNTTAGLSSTSLEEDAYLDSLYGTNFDTANGVATNSDVQASLWDILDPSDYSHLNSTEKDLVSDAASFISSASSTDSFYSQFTLFTPITSDKYGWTRGEPQIFLQYTPAKSVTPEPESLVLLGTGIAGLAGILRKRMGRNRE